MGKRLEQVTEELSSVRKQLEKMEQETNKTLKATVCKAVESLEQQCQKMKKQLFEIKIEVKAKASEIVAETKAKGKAALHPQIYTVVALCIYTALMIFIGCISYGRFMNRRCTKA